MIKSFHSSKPRIHPDTYISKQSLIIGKVSIEKNASVWPGAVLRGDVDEIIIHEGSNLQDGVLVHVNFDLPAVIGKKVTVGHGAILHGCRIGDGCLIGMGAIILDGAIVGDRSIIGAGCVVTEGMCIPKGSLVVGVPGKRVRSVTREEVRRIEKNAREYQAFAQQFKKETSL